MKSVEREFAKWEEWNGDNKMFAQRKELKDEGGMKGKRNTKKKKRHFLFVEVPHISNTKESQCII